MKKTILCILLLLCFLLQGKQMPIMASTTSLNFTTEEALFIEEHPVIELGVDPSFVPFEFMDQGVYKGIAADYLRLISLRTGITFQVREGLTWPEAYELALAGELPMLPAISKTEEREEHFLFSKPYYYFKRVIVTSDTELSIGDVKDLEGLVVAVQRGSSHHSYLMGFPKINLSLYDSVESALTAVANGRERAFVGNLATTNHLIRTTALTNLKFTAFASEMEEGIHFAVGKEWSMLISILNRALDTITEEERIDIASRWIQVETVRDNGPLVRVLMILAGTLGVIISVSFYWILKLRREAAIRLAAQEALEVAKKEAEEANEFKSSFMARMSHEVRTPLNAIMGMSYLLKKTQVSLTQRTYIDRIQQASNNMLSIINDILDFSKIEAGKVELEHTSFSLDQVVQQVVNIVAYKIDERGIGFKLSKDPKLPTWFFGDGKRVEQVLLNLLSNAAKFTEEGEVSLDVRLLAKEGKKYRISFAVEDTGIGMEKAQIEKLFTPFTQGDSSINRRFGGSGLGLSIVKNLVDLMGGTIEVYSTKGEGTTFVLHVTLTVDEDQEASHLQRLQSSHLAPVRILVLEKSGAGMNLMESYLRSFGMQCELTTSESSALSMLEKSGKIHSKAFDLVIVDYDAPKVNGFAFAEEIQNKTSMKGKPKVLVLVPMQKEALYDEAEKYPVDMVLGKPLIPSILLDAMVDLFDMKAVADGAMENPREEVSYVARKKVLLAEDNKTNQLIAKSLLTRVGIEVLVAEDGQKAVDLFKLHKEDIGLILMDLHMPVKNGYEAAEEIRTLSREVPMIAMTADVVLGVKERCMEVGMMEYISKPFDPEAFIEKVKELLPQALGEEKEEPLLNVAFGLKNLGGNELLYVEVLKEYKKENEHVGTSMEEAFHQKDFEAMMKMIHKIKSSSGSIGAKGFYEHCVGFQKSLEKGMEEDIKRDLERFHEFFTKLMEEITKYVSQ